MLRTNGDTGTTCTKYILLGYTSKWVIGYQLQAIFTVFYDLINK
jgi:hypothetical protein